MEPTIYLNFKGNCLEAMTHYAKVLGGEVSGVFLNKDTPAGEERMSGSDDMVLNMNMRLRHRQCDGLGCAGRVVLQAARLLGFHSAGVTR